MRMIVYIFEFLISLIKYKNKKYPIEKLQIWCGQICTLKCANCSQLFPYIEPKLYNIDNAIKDIEIILKFCDVQSIHIIGGEPFVNKDIGKLIHYICKQDNKSINKIVTNGTILPSEENLKLLASNYSKIKISVSPYGCVKEKQDKFLTKCLENNINIEMNDLIQEWRYMGDNKQKKIKNITEVYKNFKSCWDRTCTTIADGQLSVCPRMKNSDQVFKYKNLPIEHLIISALPQNIIGKALIAACLTKKTYRKACRFCYGNGGRNKKVCAVAEQLVQIKSETY